MKKSILLICLSFFSWNTYACSCIMYTPKTIYLDSVTYVFTGTVTQLIEIPYKKSDYPNWIDTLSNKAKEGIINMSHRKRFAAYVVVEDVYKEGLIKNDTLYFKYQGSNCHPKFKINETMLFFAEEDENGRFSMTACTPWGRLEEVGETLESYEKFKE